MEFKWEDARSLQRGQGSQPQETKWNPCFPAWYDLLPEGKADLSSHGLEHKLHAFDSLDSLYSRSFHKRCICCVPDELHQCDLWTCLSSPKGRWKETLYSCHTLPSSSHFLFIYTALSAASELGICSKRKSSTYHSTLQLLWVKLFCRLGEIQRHKGGF